MTFRPTDEQLEALALFRAGDSMVIEAGAGTGKTATLRLLAAATKRRGRYMAFNKAIVTDVANRISERCQASTAHSLAFRAIGKRYVARLNAGRMRSKDIARALQIDPMTVMLPGGAKALSDGYLGGLAMRSITRFCQSLHEEPSRLDVPYIVGIDMPDDDGNRTYENNNLVGKALEPALTRAWEDVRRIDGSLPFKHDYYLKLWQLARPRIETDYLLFDEAQDADPVMADVVGRQDHAQRVYVGDAQQAIYEWRGAVNAMDGFGEDARCLLTQSFRFGQAIAEEANELLDLLDAPLRLSGLDSIASEVAECAGTPDAVLCRSNAAAMKRLMRYQAQGVAAHLVGGGAEVLAFARAAKELQQEGWTAHPELTCFSSWGEVREYVRADAQGDELRLLVDLVEEFGVNKVLRGLEAMASVHAAEVTISTAHKAKGREWGRVVIGDDFADCEPETPELRLRYVAFTRARLLLDKTALEREENTVPEPPALELIEGGAA